MPKTKVRRKAMRGESQGRISAPREMLPLASSTAKTGQERRGSARRIRTPHRISLLMPALVALGCWGMAVSFIFFSTYADRNIFGGMAVLMALMWSFSFALRVRKMMP